MTRFLSRRTTLGLEPLDRRDLPAVTAALNTASGLLAITGDWDPNTVSVSEHPVVGVGYILGGVSSLSVNGAPANPAAPIPPFLVRRIEADLGWGDDTFTLTRQVVTYSGNGWQPNPYLGLLQGVAVDGWLGNDRIDLTNAGTAPATLLGGIGNDTLIGGSGHDRIDGGNWSDSLVGGAGNDTLIGGSGDDTLKGGNGADNLYGRAGNDQLYGENGNDGLFAGMDGAAELVAGGAGADRYLVPDGHFLIDGLATEDAVLVFKNSGPLEDLTFTGREGTFDFAAGAWADADVERVDVALGNLHRHTGNTALLERSGGSGSTTLLAVGAMTDGGSNVGGWNSGGQTIAVVSPELKGDMSMNRLVYHEFGHNWDTAAENPFANAFRAVSGWVESDLLLNGYTASSGFGDKWHYLTSKSNTFARGYGKSNPLEDMATTWEAYFVNAYHGGAAGVAAEGMTICQEKWDTLDDLFASLS